MAKSEPMATGGAKQSYVVEGATLKCSCGDRESRLNVLTHNIGIKNKAQANIMDYKPTVNVMPFGQCSSLANPIVAAATAANKGVLKKMPCIPVLTMPWINGKTDKQVGGFPALLDKSTNMCLYCGRITIENDGQE